MSTEPTTETQIDPDQQAAETEKAFRIRATFFRNPTDDSRILQAATPQEVKRDGYTFPLTDDPKRHWIFPTRAAAEQKKRVLVRHFGEDFFTVEPAPLNEN